MGLNYDAEAKILSGLAVNFIESEAIKHEVYLHDEDVNVKGAPYTLPDNRCVKVTFEYADKSQEEG